MALRNVNDEKYPQFANDIKYWMDDRVSDAGSAIYSGGIQVLTAGFGKGVLAAAALLTVGIVALFIASPATVGLSVAATVAQSVEAGLMFAGNALLGHPLGFMALFTGGAIGSMAAAHGENTRIGKDAAQIQAMQFAKAREGNAQSPQLAPENDLCTGGHCAKLMREQNKDRDNDQRGQAR